SAGADAGRAGGVVLIWRAGVVGPPGQEGQAHTDEGHGLRMRDAARGRGQRAAFGEVLFGGDALHTVRYRGGFSLSLGRGLQENAALILGSMVSFLAILFIGYVYALKKGALDWKS